MTWMMKLMLCFYYSLIHDLMKGKVTGLEPPITLVVPGLDPSLTVAPGPTPADLPES